MKAHDIYEARILAEDRSGIIWTPEEEQAIAQYAQKLRENATHRTLSGDLLVSELGRQYQAQQARTIESWYTWGEPSQHGKVVCAELRRQMAGRERAFELAGVDLVQKVN